MLESNDRDDDRSDKNDDRSDIYRSDIYQKFPTNAVSGKDKSKNQKFQNQSLLQVSGDGGVGPEVGY
jgi:hypothetical protein